MASSLNNLSSYDKEQLGSLPDFRFGIVVAEWNEEITTSLLSGARKILKECDVPEDHIEILKVPGSFELSSGASFFCERRNVDAVICLGCIIQGETRHFEFIAQAVANGLTMLCLRHQKPVIFGVLTTDTLEQAKDRAGGKHGNKGIEAAVSAVKMLLSFHQGKKKKVGF